VFQPTYKAQDMKLQICTMQYIVKFLITLYLSVWYTTCEFYSVWIAYSGTLTLL